MRSKYLTIQKHRGKVTLPQEKLLHNQKAPEKFFILKVYVVVNVHNNYSIQ